MSGHRSLPIRGRERAHRDLVLGSCCLVVVYWAALGSAPFGYPLPYVRPITGTLLLGVLPGALAYNLLGKDTDRLGLFAVFSVGMSLAIVSTLAVLLSVLSPLVGISRPLSTIPFVTAVTVIVVLLTAVSTVRDTARFSYPRFDRWSAELALLLLSLPLLAVLAAWLMNEYDVNAVMYVVLFGVAAIVVVGPRWIPKGLYPLSVFSVAAAVLLHRNLISPFVIGHDVQLNYYLSMQIADLGRWDPALGGSLISLPVVTAVPVVYSSVTGIAVALVMKGIYSVVLAFVPVGVFYLADDVFDADVAFLGSLFFVVFHSFFESTPDKQPIAELFAVLVLLTLFYRFTRSATDYLLLIVLSIGLIQSHYGLTYVFAIVLFSASVLVYVTQIATRSSLDNRLFLSYAVLLFLAATEWYVLTSSELAFRLRGLPFTIIEQLSLLLSLTVPLSDSGASYTNQARESLYSVIVYLYVVMTALIGLGVLRRALGVIGSYRRDNRPRDAEIIALAGVMFVLLGSSYFISGNLGADRLYQIALLVLGPFVAIGYATVRSAVSRFAPSVTDRSGWTPVMGLLIAILLVNAGVVYQAAGLPPTDVTLDDDTHDFVYTRAEVEGARWIDAYAGIDQRNGTLARVMRQERIGITEAKRTTTDTRIYTDEYSLAMFRAVVPPEYYQVETLNLKDDEYGLANATGGYIYLRERAVIDTNRGQVIPRQNVSQSEVRYIAVRDDLIYTNGDARIFLAENDSTTTAASSPGNESSERARLTSRPNGRVVSVGVRS